MQVDDLSLEDDMTAAELVDALRHVGLQATELARAASAITNMQRDGATTYLTFTSNMVSSGLRGLFAQCIRLGIADVIVTTVGSVEEDIMRAHGESFSIHDFDPDDITLYEQGRNRVGNILIENESYQRFENVVTELLGDVAAEHERITPSALLERLGNELDDDESILAQAARNDVPIFCPAITDGAFGFHLYMVQEDHPEFTVDVVRDFENVLFSSSRDAKKGVIALGGGSSKHHAILASLLNGGMDYAAYLTTSRKYSGSIGGATTDEAKSWGKIRGDSDAATVIGDVSITFPLVMTRVLDTLREEGLV